MKHHKSLLTASALLSLTTLTAEASLTAGTAGGQSVVYDSGSNITWTGDANLLGTLENTYGYDTIVNAIIAASPTITDLANVRDTPAGSGYHTVSASDFSHTYNPGEVTWFGAKAFTIYLNSINYAGSNQWTLPTTVNDSTSFSGSYGHTTSSQLEALFYNGLGGKKYQAIPNTGVFTNELANLYWSGTEVSYYSNLTYLAWNFVTSTGIQDAFDKTQSGYAWAVTAGNITAVPVPAAAWLFGSGLIGMVGWKRRNNIR